MKYRIAAVSYLNTKPFLQGFSRTGFDRNVDLFILPPSQCAEFLIDQKVDIALCPVGALHKMENYHILGSHCIGCDGAVRTVALYSDVPLEAMEGVYLDAHSRTSNLLIQILLNDYWKLAIPVLPPPENGKRARTGLLSIGDRCFALDKLFQYKYDLGEAWKAYTGLPFVFAAWVSIKPVPGEVIQLLDAACHVGVMAITTLDADKGIISDKELREYLTHAIDYPLDEKKRHALQVFLTATDTLITSQQTYVT